MTALYHCSCLHPVSTSHPPPATVPLALYEHHPLGSLLFCEECDAVRCDSCATVEIAGYYCPSCMFEVPSASVRSEKNRCARNCFQCPLCDNTLAVTMSECNSDDFRGQPYVLTCSACAWNSREVGISFEKPTGLSLQLQAAEETAPELREFDKIRDHLEPYVRRGQAQAQAAAASSFGSSAHATLLRDVPGLANRYSSILSSSIRNRNAVDLRARDELAPYQSTSRNRQASDEERVLAVKRMKGLYDATSLSQRWTMSWNAPLLPSTLKPQRTPLQAKRSKRCPVCRHILTKPEPKATSTRYKIKLAASNYLPAIELKRRAPPTASSRLSVVSGSHARGASTSAVGQTTPSTAYASLDDPLRPGRTYTFEITCANPLYEPIKVRLAVARPKAPSDVPEAKPPFAVHLPSSTFPIEAFAEDWEYDDDDDYDQDNESTGPTSGIVRKKRNTTTVQMDVAVSKDAQSGPLRANMLVTYVYTDQMDAVERQEGEARDADDDKGTKAATKSKEKTFTFWTLLYLGTVQPRPTATGADALATPRASRRMGV